MFLVVFGCYGILNTIKERLFPDACHRFGNSHGSEFFHILANAFRNLFHIIAECKRGDNGGREDIVSTERTISRIPCNRFQIQATGKSVGSYAFQILRDRDGA